MAMANCIASSSRAHMPVPQARTAASTPTPAPATASSSAAPVKNMQITHESGTQRSVKREREAPRCRNHSIIG